MASSVAMRKPPLTTHVKLGISNNSLSTNTHSENMVHINFRADSKSTAE